MKKMLLLSVVLLAGCTSPAVQMHPEQIAQLSDQQLCSLKRNYMYDANTEVEIGRRNLDCNPFAFQCRNEGHEPNTPALAMCISQKEQMAAMQKQVQTQQNQIQQQQRQLQRAQQDAAHQQRLNAMRGW